MLRGKVSTLRREEDLDEIALGSHPGADLVLLAAENTIVEEGKKGTRATPGTVARIVDHRIAANGAERLVTEETDTPHGSLRKTAS